MEQEKGVKTVGEEVEVLAMTIRKSLFVLSKEN